MAERHGGYDLDARGTGRHARGLRLGRRLGATCRRRPVARLAPPATEALNVTGGGLFTTDQLSMDIFVAAQALRPGAVDLLGGLEVERVLAIGASQSAAA